MYKEVEIMWKGKESYVFGLSIIKHVTLQKIVAHDFRYDPRISVKFDNESHFIKKASELSKFCSN